MRATFREDRQPGCYSSEVKRSAASHEDEKYPGCRSYVVVAGRVLVRSALLEVRANNDIDAAIACPA